MPTDKDFKRLVRGRMHKTGESYTAARAQLRKQKPATSPVPRPSQYAAIAGKSDALIKERTGHLPMGPLLLFDPLWLVIRHRVVQIRLQLHVGSDVPILLAL